MPDTKVTPSITGVPDKERLQALLNQLVESTLRPFERLLDELQQTSDGPDAASAVSVLLHTMIAALCLRMQPGDRNDTAQKIADNVASLTRQYPLPETKDLPLVSEETANAVH